jgi:DNA-binding NtrC family response regulator
MSNVARVLKHAAHKSELEACAVKEPVIILAADIDQLKDLRAAVAAGPYHIIECDSTADLSALVSDSASSVVILDLDSVSVDNKFLRLLKANNPGLSILTLSGQKLHPELRESIASYIHACLSKPLDADELTFWLKSITQDTLEHGGQSPTNSNTSWP